MMFESCWWRWHFRVRYSYSLFFYGLMAHVRFDMLLPCSTTRCMYLETSTVVWSISIRHWSDALALGRCLIDVDPWGFVTWTLSSIFHYVFLIQAAKEVHIQALMNRCDFANFSAPLSPPPGPGCPYVEFDGPCVRGVAQHCSTFTITVLLTTTLGSIYKYASKII